MSKGIVGSSLKQLARPLLGSPGFAMLPAMGGSALTRLVGRRSLTCSGEAGVTIFTQGAQFIAQVIGWDAIALTMAMLWTTCWTTMINIVADIG
jgi:hypothetical protein